ncbi:MAG TPA: class I SAM-dependent methyltransferase [Planctomycetota bacterium]|nr:class I SAM-dependent methyltransferase [Planctomycetota bacterium]
MPPLVETAAHSSDGARLRIVDRAWYAYAARLLPEAAGAGRWLDLGCGQGEFLELAAARGLAGWGLDYWQRNAAAVLAGGRPALVADLNRPLPFRDASLDGASMIEVIEHIVRAESVVAELARVIRPQGWLVLTTPNVVHLTYRLRTLTGHPPKQEGYHVRFFTRKTLGELLTSAGFRPVGYASFGKQVLLSKLGRLTGKGPKYKYRYVVPRPFEPLLAQHFVWRLQRGAAAAGEGASGT